MTTIDSTDNPALVSRGVLLETQGALKSVDLRTLPKDARQPVKDAREAVKAALGAIPKV